MNGRGPRGWAASLSGDESGGGDGVDAGGFFGGGGGGDGVGAGGFPGGGGGGAGVGGGVGAGSFLPGVLSRFIKSFWHIIWLVSEAFHMHINKDKRGKKKKKEKSLTKFTNTKRLCKWKA